MKQNDHIQDKIDSTFNVLDAIEEVSVSKDFSSRVLQKITGENMHSETVSSSWFTPQLQFAAMFIVLIMNTSVIYYALNTSNPNENVSGIEQFAKDYNINSESSISLN